MEIVFVSIRATPEDIRRTLQEEDSSPRFRRLIWLRPLSDDVPYARAARLVLDQLSASPALIARFATQFLFPRNKRRVIRRIRKLTQIR